MSNSHLDSITLGFAVPSLITDVVALGAGSRLI
jgi:hypothetical protein